MSSNEVYRYTKRIGRYNLLLFAAISTPLCFHFQCFMLSVKILGRRRDKSAHLKTLFFLLCGCCKFSLCSCTCFPEKFTPKIMNFHYAWQNTWLNLKCWANLKAVLYQLEPGLSWFWTNFELILSDSFLPKKSDD